MKSKGKEEMILKLAGLLLKEIGTVPPNSTKLTSIIAHKLSVREFYGHGITIVEVKEKYIELCK